MHVRRSDPTWKARTARARTRLRTYWSHSAVLNHCDQRDLHNPHIQAASGSASCSTILRLVRRGVSHLVDRQMKWLRVEATTLLRRTRVGYLSVELITYTQGVAITLALFAAGARWNSLCQRVLFCRRHKREVERRSNCHNYPAHDLRWSVRNNCSA